MGTLSVVQQLVEALDPKEIDQTLEDGKTALMLACKMGRPMTTKLLLDAKADPMLRERRDKGADGFLPIMHAALFGHVDCVATLLRHVGQDKAMHQALLREHNGDHFTALHLAALHGQRRMVHLLLRERAEVDSRNAQGETPLHVSSKNGHAQAVCSLLASGASVNQTDKRGRTALHHCCTPGGKDVAGALMELGAEVNLPDHEGNTPLHLACATGNLRAVDALLKYRVGDSAPEPRIQPDPWPNLSPCRTLLELPYQTLRACGRRTSRCATRMA